jgi:hypothetical protein
MIRRTALIAAFAGFGAGLALAQDPQGVVNSLIKRQIETNQLQHRNEMLRLELQNDELKEQLKYHHATDSEIEGELALYCRAAEPPCWRSPPPALVDEAARRGLIKLEASKPRRPNFKCITMGDGEGGGITECQ